MKQMPQLDSLRAFAVALVMWAHWLPRYTFGVDWGRAGVTLFFVLSGFLITGILLNGRKERITPSRMLGRFYIRRILRIFPLFYFLNLMAAWLNAPGARDALGWHLAFLSNVYFYLQGAWNGPTSHFWSLAVEEQFYCIWPLLILLLPLRLLPFSMIALGGASAVFRVVTWNMPLSSYTTPAVLDALCLGALLGYAKAFWQFVWQHRRTPWILGAIGILFLTAGIPHLFQSGCAFLSGALILAAAKGIGGPVGDLLNLRHLRYLGTISYGLYVYHNFAGFLLADIAGLPHEPSIIRLPIFALFTIGLAHISWQFFESPINSLKRLFPYKLPESLPTAGPAAVTTFVTGL